MRCRNAKGVDGGFVMPKNIRKQDEKNRRFGARTAARSGARVRRRIRARTPTARLSRAYPAPRSKKFRRFALLTACPHSCEIFPHGGAGPVPLPRRSLYTPGAGPSHPNVQSIGYFSLPINSQPVANLKTASVCRFAPPIPKSDSAGGFGR